MLDPANLITILATAALVILCVFIHYEGLSALSRWVAHGVLPARMRIAVIIFGQLVLHVAEIFQRIDAINRLVAGGGRERLFGSFTDSHSLPCSRSLSSLHDFDSCSRGHARARALT